MIVLGIVLLFLHKVFCGELNNLCGRVFWVSDHGAAGLESCWK